MKNKKEVLVKIEGEEWKSAIDKAFEKKVKTVKVDGFREGKCPRDVYEKKYGKESLYMEAIDYVIDNAYKKALEDSKLLPVIQPHVHLNNINDEEVEFKFEIITRPEIKINKYKGIKINKEKIEVSKEEIDAEIKVLREQYSEMELKDDAIVNGDVAVINFEGFKDGEVFEGGKGENYPLEIGSNTFIPGFEDQLLGKKSGEDVEIKVTFPEDYMSDELKGKEVIFKTHIIEVKNKNIPDLNKDFFEDLHLDNIDSVEKLEKYFEDEITKRKEKEAENIYLDKLLEEIAKETQVDINDEIIESEVDYMIEQYSNRLKMQGIELEQYLEFTKTDINTLRENYKEDAKKGVLYRYILEEIREKENIEITDKDVEQELNNLSVQYNTSVEEVKKAIGNISIVKYDLSMKKTIDFLKDNN